MAEPEPSRLVKPPQSRDGTGISAVYLEPAAEWGAGGGMVYVKRQNAYWCRPPWRGFRRTPTLRRELRGLAACRSLGIPVPEVVHYREDGPEAELVTREVPRADPFDRALRRQGADRDIIVSHVAATIARLHRAGWTHGALYPDHILVGSAADHPVVLIDLEKARRSRLRRRGDLERFRRHNAAHLTRREVALFEERYAAALTGTATGAPGSRPAGA